MWRFTKKYAVEIRVASVCVAAIALLTAGITWRTYWLPYDVFVPLSAGQKPIPALVVLHGRSGDAAVLRNWLGLDEFAEQRGFMVIYPQSHQDAWDFGVGIRERGHVRRRYLDHPRYVLDIVERVNDLHPIDRERLFVAGVSDSIDGRAHVLR